MRVRIQKKLAQAGVASRREVERMIEAGRIQVNDKPAEIGQSIGSKDRIKIDGKPVRIEFELAGTEVLLYHKPQGEIVARVDPEGRPIVFDALPEPKSGRWVAIGRLDINTSGLILFTNNGELAHRLMHPSYEIIRGYAVRVLGEADEDSLRQLKKGVELEDGPAKFDSIEAASGATHDGANRWFNVTLKEGRNREVRRMWEAVGLTVSRLSRIHFDVIQLPRDLHRSQTRSATLGQVNRLLERVGLEPETQAETTQQASPYGGRERGRSDGQSEYHSKRQPARGRGEGRSRDRNDARASGRNERRQPSSAKRYDKASVDQYDRRGNTGRSSESDGQANSKTDSNSVWGNSRPGAKSNSKPNDGRRRNDRQDDRRSDRKLSGRDEARPARGHNSEQNRGKGSKLSHAKADEFSSNRPHRQDKDSGSSSYYGKPKRSTSSSSTRVRKDRSKK